jgi:hypothetical protein
MKRLLAAALWGVSLVAAGAVATGLPTTATSLGAGTAALVPCDGNGYSVTYQQNAAGQLTSVTLVNVNAGCAGGTARVTLLNGSSVLASGTASLPSSGFTGTVVVSLSSAVNPTSVTKTAAVIDGV